MSVMIVVLLITVQLSVVFQFPMLQGEFAKNVGGNGIG